MNQTLFLRSVKSHLLVSELKTDVIKKIWIKWGFFQVIFLIKTNLRQPVFLIFYKKIAKVRKNSKLKKSDF